jgi:hypothetical protein
LRVVGQVMHTTATLAFTEGRVFDGRGQLCAHATGTFKYLRALPVNDREVRPAPAVNVTPLQGPGSD